jgi:hypothetical protein
MLETNANVIHRNNTQLMNLLRERRRNGVPYRKIAHEFTLMGVLTEQGKPVSEPHLCKLITQGPDGRAYSGGREAKAPPAEAKIMSAKNKDFTNMLIQMRNEGMDYKDIEHNLNSEGWRKPSGAPVCRASLSQIMCRLGYRTKNKYKRNGDSKIDNVYGKVETPRVRVPTNFTPPAEKPQLGVRTEYVPTPKKDWVLWVLLGTQAILVASLLLATVAQ